MNSAKSLWFFFVSLWAVLAPCLHLSAQNLILRGIYSNLAFSPESGDLNGFEITVLPQANGTQIVFQCSQGAPSSPVLVAVQENGRTISFAVNQEDSACNGSYTGEITSGGLLLRGPEAQKALLSSRVSYWSVHPSRRRREARLNSR